MQCPCAHQPTRLLADRTLDDDLAGGHVRTDKVEAFRTAFEAKRHRLPHAQAEKIADLELVAPAIESETRDRPLGAALQGFRNKAREIDPPIRGLLEPEDEGAHGKSARK
jgi:hypothetical protein